MSLFVGLMSAVAASAWTQASTDSIETEGVRFGTGASIGTITEKMRITRGGLVGVSTQSPTATLQVSGSLTVSTSAQTTTPSLFVETNGNVGFGTSAPSKRLHVYGTGFDGGSGRFETVNSGNGVYIYGQNGVGVVDTAYMMLMNSNSPTTSINFIGLTGNNAIPNDLRLVVSGSEVFRAKANGNVGIGTTGPIAKLDVVGNVSVTGMIDVGHTAQACSTAISGSIRYSAVSSTMEYCNSTAWTSLGPSDTAVGFLATGSQTIGPATAILTGWSEQRDDGSGFNPSTGIYVAPSAGYYTFSISTQFTDANANYPRLYITDGARYVCDTFELANDGNYFRSCSGTTYLATGQTVTAYAGAPGGSTGSTSYFSGHKTGAPASSGGGGGATPAGSTGDIQFNSAGALAADTGQLFWDATNNRLGIGTTTPTVALHVVGDIAYTGVMSDVSDRRMKRDITTLSDAVAERLMLLKPVTFRMKDVEDTEYGFIAQDVQQVFPELVRNGEILSLNYVGLIAPAVKTIQLLKRENDEQGDRIDALAEQNRLLRIQVKELMLETRKTQREVERLTGAVH